MRHKSELHKRSCTGTLQCFLCAVMVFSRCSSDPSSARWPIRGQSQTHTSPRPLAPFENAATLPHCPPSSPWAPRHLLPAAIIPRLHELRGQQQQRWAPCPPSLPTPFLFHTSFLVSLYFYSSSDVQPIWDLFSSSPHPRPLVVYEANQTAYAADTIELSKEFCHDRRYFPRYY